MFKRFCTKAKCLGRLCSCNGEHEDDDASQLHGPPGARPIELIQEIEANRRRQRQALPHNLSNPQHETHPEGEDYPPLPASEHGSHAGYTPQLSNASVSDTPFSNDDFDSLPASTRYSHTEMAPAISQYNFDDEVEYRANNSSSYGFESAADEGMDNVSIKDGIQSQPSNASSGTKRSIAEVHQDNTNEPWASSELSERASKRSRSSEHLDDRPSEAHIARYRELGVRYQTWIEDASAPGCMVLPATLTAAELFEAPEPDRWERTHQHWSAQPPALDDGDLESTDLGTPHYRSVTASKWNVEAEEYNFYDHANALGIIVGMNIFRLNGPYWNEVAKALYELDHPISTLRNIAFCNVVNEETQPYITNVLYPQHNTLWENARDQPCKKFERGTRSYEELLGTQLGRAAASLVISSFPRGSMMISRAVTWASGPDVQVRFEISSLVN